MQDGKYLTFELMGQIYAIDIGYVKEILNGCGSISPVPEFPEYGKGVINLRGDIVPIIDMRIRFHQPAAVMNNATCIIVTESRTETGADYLGFAVDRVNAVMDFEGADITEPPSLSMTTSKYIIGVYKAVGQIIMILDPDKLLTDDMKEAIGEYMGNVEDNKD